MKKVVLFAAITIASIAVASAQLTLTASTCTPVAGDVYLGHKLDSSLVTPGSSGAIVTWNFGSLVGGELDTTSFMTCSASPYCDSFAGSDLVSYDQSDYTYMITSASKMTGIGAYSSPDYIHFTDQKDFLRYPFTYHNGYKDTTILTTGGVTLHMVDTNYADGYGTLILPSGTYTNVLRIHSASVSQYSFSGFPVGGDSTEKYMWFKPGIHSPLLTLNLDTTGGTMHVVSAKYYTGPAYTTAVGNVNTGLSPLSVFPNPSADQVHFTFTLDNNTDANVTISDITGRTIAVFGSNELVKGTNSIAYSVVDMNAGVYILRLHTAQGISTQKFVVNK